jgi:hypothetical protein
MTDEEKDLAFLEEYRQLCEKHNRCIDFDNDWGDDDLCVKRYSEGSYIYTEQKIKEIYDKSVEESRIKLEQGGRRK